MNDIIYEAVNVLSKISNGGFKFIPKNTNWDECVAKCIYHALTTQQQMYCKFKETKNCDHFVCLIYDNNHHEPCVNISTKENIVAHFANAHNQNIQIFLMLSNFI